MKNESKQQILARQKELKQELVDMLVETRSDFSLAHVLDAIYNEEDNDDMMKIIAMFDRGGDATELENVLELVSDAWNYFPHKSLGGISPAEKMVEYRKEDGKMKKPSRNLRGKLSKRQIGLLWGGGDKSPYSQANLIKQIRIIDDSVSRIFLVVEAEINPTTFEIVTENRYCDELKGDAIVQQLLNGAEYRGPEFGYVGSAFEKEYANDEVMLQAEASLKYTQECIIRMHKFVIKQLKLKK
jgi:hypothetical protein